MNRRVAEQGFGLVSHHARLEGRWRVAVAWTALTVAALPVAAPAQDVSGGARFGPITAQLEQAEQADRRGDKKGAIERYDAACADARKANNVKAEAEALLRSAQTRQAMAVKSPDSAALLSRAAADLEKAIALGNPSQKVQSQNSLGILHLQLKNYTQAYRIFSTIPVAEIEQAQRFVYHYNIARSLDLQGYKAAAYPIYLTSFQENTRSSAAPRRAFDMLLSGRVDAPVAKASELATELVNAAQGPLAAELIRRGLDAWGNDPEATLLLIPLVRHYARSFVWRVDFLATEWPLLQTLAKKHTNLAVGLGEIHDAFVKDLEPSADLFRRRDLAAFPFWTGNGLPHPGAYEGCRAFAALLGHIGDDYLNRVGEQGSPAPDQTVNARMAYAHYAAAWTIDRYNTQAAVACATVLHDYSSLLDRDHRLYDQLVASMFEGEQRKYAIQGGTADGWLNILRMHFVLGSIFAQEKRWGSETEQRSAIFQWNLALTAKPEVYRSNSRDDYCRVPGLHRNLAEAYSAVGRKDDSFDQYLFAARDYTVRGDTAAADESLKLARTLSGVKLTEERQTLLTLLTTSPLDQRFRGVRSALDMFALLSNASCQREIRLDLQQVAQAHALAQAYNARGNVSFKLFQSLQGHYRWITFSDVDRAISASALRPIGEFLKPEQINRLAQISYQRLGDTALLYENVAAMLKLTDRQRSEISTLAWPLNVAGAVNPQATPEEREAARKKAAERRKEIVSKMFATLNQEQQKTWKEMLGPPFEFLPDRGKD